MINFTTQLLYPQEKPR